MAPPASCRPSRLAATCWSRPRRPRWPPGSSPASADSAARAVKAEQAPAPVRAPAPPPARRPTPEPDPGPVAGSSPAAGKTLTTRTVGRDMTVLVVTGSSGRLGGRVAQQLADAGRPQRLLVRDLARAPQLPASEVVVAHYRDGDAV